MKVTKMEVVLPWKAHSDPLSINLCAQINSHSTSNSLILKSFLFRARDPASFTGVRVYESKGSSQVVGNHSGLHHRRESEIRLKRIWKSSSPGAAVLSSHPDLATYSSSSISMDRMLYNCLLLLSPLSSHHKQWTWMHKIQETETDRALSLAILLLTSPGRDLKTFTITALVLECFPSVIIPFSLHLCLLPNVNTSLPLSEGSLTQLWSALTCSSLFWTTAVFLPDISAHAFFSLPVPHTDLKLQNRAHFTFGLLLFSLHLECAQNTAAIP